MSYNHIYDSMNRKHTISFFILILLVVTMMLNVITTAQEKRISTLQTKSGTNPNVRLNDAVRPVDFSPASSKNSGAITQGILTTYCAGVNDSFACPIEPAKPSNALYNYLQTRLSGNCTALLNFDEIPWSTQCATEPRSGWFGHTFTFPTSSCGLQSATLSIRLKASPGGNPGSDFIAFYENATFISGSFIKNLSGTGGTWSNNQQIQITLDLAALSNGFKERNILRLLNDGDLDIVVASHTGVDYACLNVTLQSSLCCINPPSGMVAWWPGEFSAEDISGNTLNGAEQGGAIYSSGKVDQAFSFDGVNDYIEVPNASSLNFGTGDFSIDAWVLTAGNTGTHVLLDKRDLSSGYLGYEVFVSAGKIGLQLDDGNYTNFGSNAQIANNQWHHIAITVERANTTGIKFYVDGVIISTGNPTVRTGSLTNTKPLRFGGLPNDVGFFNGKIDELELFNRALDSSEVSAMFNAGSAGKCKPSCPTVSHIYDLDISPRWNLVSLPAQISSSLIQNVFPNAISMGFTFNGSYSPSDSLKSGKGYWLKFPVVVDRQKIVGTMKCQDTETLEAGWNLIGAPGWQATAESLKTTPAGIITSQFYEFNNGYQATSVLEPGKGYWIKTSNAGTIEFSESQSLAKTQDNNAISSAVEKLNSLILTDSLGNHQTLYFGSTVGQNFNSEYYSLPPIPPDGVFDVRFSSQKMVEVYPQKPLEVGYRINLRNIAYPLKIAWNISGNSGDYFLANANRDPNQTVIPLKGITGSNTIESVNGSTLLLIINTARSIPSEFALKQCYPNPFNPTTSIRYQLPMSGKVMLKIYNVLGQEVKTLVDEMQDAGFKSVEWNANEVASGVYFYRITVQGDGATSSTFTDQKKMLLIK